MVVVDSPVWSLYFRRKLRELSRAERALVLDVRELIAKGRSILLGPVRQELLTGVRDMQHFHQLRDRLRALDDTPLKTGDFELAAQFANDCIASGIAIGNTDMLICAYAAQRRCPILTLDRDFVRYASKLPIALHFAGLHR